ncbi:hypothetical protein GCM10009857_17290 [Agromyces soli]
MGRAWPGASEARTSKLIPHSVALAWMCSIVGGVVSGFLAGIQLLLLLPEARSTEDATKYALLGTLLLIWFCCATLVAGRFARQGSGWPRWIMCALAISAVPLMVGMPLAWLVFAAVSISAAALWSPAARAYARDRSRG